MIDIQLYIYKFHQMYISYGEIYSSIKILLFAKEFLQLLVNSTIVE